MSSNLWIRPESGFGTGFDRFDTLTTERHAKLNAHSLQERLDWAREAARARSDDGAKAVRNTLSGLSAESRDQPSFWFVNLVECHSPYLPPRPHNDLGVLDRLRAGEEARRYLNMGAIWQACLGVLQVPAEAVGRMRHLYQRSIVLLDEWLGQVLEDLDMIGVLDETLVIVTSDHGENIGDGGLMGHAFSLDERLLRVPLAACGPGSEHFANVASLSELPRRIARALDLTEHPWMNGLPEVEGVTTAQLDPPAIRGHPKTLQAASEWDLDREAELMLTGTQDCAIEDRWKLLVRTGGEQFFDLAGDPLEVQSTPVANVPSEVVARLRAALDDPAFRAKPTESSRPSDDELDPISDQERQRLEESMELLGYM